MHLLGWDFKIEEIHLISMSHFKTILSKFVYVAWRTYCLCATNMGDKMI